MKLHLVRVRLNSGGYDVKGRYWGVGAPLYQYWDDDNIIDDHVRAENRESAQSKIYIRLSRDYGIIEFYGAKFHPR